ncbi:RHS repeat-associated core domain-containing protein [Streptomyces sp. NPDC048508]|uniref:RHS repeat-associated core domain-containing protein n=1 Tax=Streptomyces sp. NPDC048508 TaxID=3365561 RepID=UPI0037164033
MTRSGKSYYYLTDALGSTVALADGSGTKVASYRYSPRGVTTPTESTGVSQPYRFAGTFQDPTDLYHMGARYYDSRTGRFNQNDPSGKEKNPYLYAEGDPVNRIDPTGLFSLGGNFGAALVGGAALVVGTLLGGPVVGGTAAGCAGAFVSEQNSGSTVGESLQACAVWGAVGGVAAALLVALPTL